MISQLHQSITEEKVNRIIMIIIIINDVATAVDAAGQTVSCVTVWWREWLSYM